LNCYDEYEPISKPKEEYIEMPKDVTCDWIETENDVQRLSILLNEEFIGVDSEWRP
jgi:hypothetical protein